MKVSMSKRGPFLLKTRRKKWIIGEVVYWDGKTYLHVKKPGSQEYDDILIEDLISEICALAKLASKQQGPPDKEAAR